MPCGAATPCVLVRTPLAEAACNLVVSTASITKILRKMSAMVSEGDNPHQSSLARRQGALLPVQSERDGLECLHPDRARPNVHHFRGMPGRPLAGPRSPLGHGRTAGPLGAQRIRFRKDREPADR